jgi:hypothetical protein
MTEVFVTSATSYRIVQNGVEIFATENALASMNEVLATFGLNADSVSIYGDHSGSMSNDNPAGSGLNTYRAAVSDDTKSIDDTAAVQDEAKSIDEIIAEMNGGMKARNADRYREILAQEPETEESTEDEAEEETATDEQDESRRHVPVGAVERPEIGDLIYIDGMKSVLRTILGGVATVSAIHDTDTYVPNGESGSFIDDQYDDEDEDFGDEEHEVETTEANIMVEIEEFPGTYFSWSMLRARQEELAEQYGYKPAQQV